MHLDDGQLRAALDEELDRFAVEHLQSCVDCRRRADEIAAQSKIIGAHLAALNPQADRGASASIALARFKTQRVSNEKEIPMFRKIFNRRYRAAWAMVALVALVAVSLTFPPVQTWAEGLLAQFRVSKITVVSVPSSLGQLLGNSDLSKQIGQMLSDSVTVTKKSNGSKSAADANQATALAGFGVRLPTSRSDKPQLTVQDGNAFQFVVNRTRAQQLVDQLGANIQLPPSLDGALIKVSIPSAVAAGYGDCPIMASGTEPTKGSPGRTLANCVILTQVPSPVVDTPPSLDISALAELGLQFGGMTQAQAHAYAQTVDWTSTLVVPIPRNAAQYKQVTVDGVDGYLIQRPLDDAPEYALVWVKNKIIYAIGGIGNDTTAAMNMANSLK